MLDGLHEGERVVTRGALMIDSALQIQAQPSMMAPDLARMAMPETAPADHASHAHHASHDVHNHAAPASAPASAYVAGAAYHAGARSVLQAYFELVARLAADDAPGAHAAIREIRAGLADMRPEGLPDDAAEMFRAAVETIRASLLPDDADIEAVRERLPQVTRAVEDYLQRFGHDLPESVREAYCSMAFNDTGAAWLQAGDQIRNPYFGRRMLRCGEIRARIAADGRVAQ